MMEQVDKEVNMLKQEGRKVSKLLSVAKVELGVKKGEVDEEKGEHRRHLDLGNASGPKRSLLFLGRLNLFLLLICFVL